MAYIILFFVAIIIGGVVVRLGDNYELQKRIQREGGIGTSQEINRLRRQIRRAEGWPDFYIPGSRWILVAIILAAVVYGSSH